MMALGPEAQTTRRPRLPFTARGLIENKRGSCRESGGTTALCLAKKADLLDVRPVATRHGAIAVQFHQLPDMSHIWLITGEGITPTDPKRDFLRWYVDWLEGVKHWWA
jgi:hypothetical protein